MAFVLCTSKFHVRFWIEYRWRVRPTYLKAGASTRRCCAWSFPSASSIPLPSNAAKNLRAPLGLGKSYTPGPRMWAIAVGSVITRRSFYSSRKRMQILIENGSPQRHRGIYKRSRTAPPTRYISVPASRYGYPIRYPITSSWT